MKRLPRLAASAGALFALAGSAYAADQIAGGAGRDRAPAAAAVTIDSTAPLFQEAGLVHGQTFERCTVLTNEGPQPADVSLFGTAAQADLSPWLELELIRGTLPDGATPGDCTGFSADAADYGAGDPGVVFRGTLASLPGEDAGIADPTRWAVGERHAYLLRVHYTGDDPQQGLSTTQSFNWGVTPFDDRPPDPFGGSGGPGAPTTPAAGPGDRNAGALTAGKACTIVTFPSRSYIGARAITRPRRVSAAAKEKERRQAAKAGVVSLGSSADEVIGAGEDAATLPQAELARRAALLRRTRTLAARRTPVLVVRIAPSRNETLAVRVGLRKNGAMTSPKRWRWVRFRLNGGATKSTLKWPFTATAKMSQLRMGYNQLDLSLDRGDQGARVKGLPRTMRRSFGFVVAQPTETVPGGTDCVLN